MRSFEHRLAAGTPEADLLALDRPPPTATRPSTASSVQMPLPRNIDTDRVVSAIDPAKDVDGLTPWNAGLLVLGKPGLVPCTPQGCVILAKEAVGSLAGLNAVVVGRSILVGKPVALHLTVGRRHRDDGALAHSATCPPSAAPPTCWWSPPAGRSSCAATG